jgi:hypothetical protein
MSECYNVVIKESSKLPRLRPELEETHLMFAGVSICLQKPHIYAAA